MKAYRGYTARVEYDAEDQILVGRVENIRDVVTFYATDTASLEREFHASVDEYLAFCEERGEEPDRPYSGRILFRCAPEVHKAVAAAARREGVSVNAWLGDTVGRRLAQPESGRRTGPERGSGGRGRQAA